MGSLKVRGIHRKSMFLTHALVRSGCIGSTNKIMTAFPFFCTFCILSRLFFYCVIAFRLAQLLGAPCTQDRRTDRRTACWIVDGSWPTNKRDTEKTCKNLMKQCFLSSRPCNLDVVMLCSSYNISKIEKQES